MNRLKYTFIFLSVSLIIFVSGCGVWLPALLLHSQINSDRHRDRDDRKVTINFGEDTHRKLHDKLDKMKIKINLKNDSLEGKLDRMREKLERMHIKIDSMKKDILLINDSLPSKLEIKIEMDKLDEILNSSLEDLDKDIELSLNASMADLAKLDDIDFDELDMENIDNENFDIKFEEIDGGKFMIIKYFDEDAKEWKEIKINFHHSNTD